MKNFKKELMEKLERCGKTINDIRWIGNREEYTKKIEDFLDTDSINSKYLRDEEGKARYLVIVGDDWWIEQHDSGWGWTEFLQVPKIFKKMKEIKMVSKRKVDEAYYNLCGFAGEIRDYCEENNCDECVFYVKQEDKCAVRGIIEMKGECLK